MRKKIVTNIISALLLAILCFVTPVMADETTDPAPEANETVEEQTPAVQETKGKFVKSGKNTKFKKSNNKYAKDEIIYYKGHYYMFFGNGNLVKNMWYEPLFNAPEHAETLYCSNKKGEIITNAFVKNKNYKAIGNTSKQRLKSYYKYHKKLYVNETGQLDPRKFSNDSLTYVITGNAQDNVVNGVSGNAREGYYTLEKIDKKKKAFYIWVAKDNASYRPVKVVKNKASKIAFDRRYDIVVYNLKLTRE